MNFHSYTGHNDRTPSANKSHSFYELTNKHLHTNPHNRTIPTEISLQILCNKLVLRACYSSYHVAAGTARKVLFHDPMMKAADGHRWFCSSAPRRNRRLPYPHLLPSPSYTILLTSLNPPNHPDRHESCILPVHDPFRIGVQNSRLHSPYETLVSVCPSLHTHRKSLRTYRDCHHPPVGFQNSGRSVQAGCPHSDASMPRPCTRGQ